MAPCLPPGCVQPAVAMDMSQPQPQYGTPLPYGTGTEQHHESATPAGQTLYDDYTTWPVLRLVRGQKQHARVTVVYRKKAARAGPWQHGCLCSYACVRWLQGSAYRLLALLYAYMSESAWLVCPRKGHCHRRTRAVTTCRVGCSCRLCHVYGVRAHVPLTGDCACLKPRRLRTADGPKTAFVAPSMVQQVGVYMAYGTHICVPPSMVQQVGVYVHGAWHMARSCTHASMCGPLHGAAGGRVRVGLGWAMDVQRWRTRRAAVSKRAKRVWKRWWPGGGGSCARSSGGLAGPWRGAVMALSMCV